MKPVGFGSKPAAFLGRLPKDAPVIATDYSGIVEAVGFAFDARLRGERFATALFLDDERALVARNLASQIGAQVSDVDQRRSALTTLAAGTLVVNGTPVSNLHAYDPKVLNLGRIFARLGETLFVRSLREQHALAPTLRYSPERIVRFAPLDPRVPSSAQIGAVVPRALVIWAPDASILELSLWRFALEDLHTPVVFACAEERPDAGGVSYYGPARHLAALRGAIALIDTSLEEPGGARALARLGRGLAVTTTSGAQEYLQGALVYDPADRASIVAAALTVLGRPAPTDGGEALIPERWLQPPPPPSSEAKVSIIMPTYERPQLLKRALLCLERQTYPNIEIVVVNDGGADMSSMELPKNARLMQMEKNGGGWVAANAALATVDGEYVAILADDDMWFPDHIARLVAALESSGAQAAHSDLLSIFMERAEDGPYSIIGYDIDFDSVAEMWRLLFTDPIGAPTHLLRRKLVEELGSGDLSLPIARDYELWLRYAMKYDWVHVDAPTAVYSRRYDRAAVQENQMITVTQLQRYLPAMQMIYERYPVPGRPAIEAERQVVLNAYRAMSAPPEPVLRLPPRRLPDQ